jgi:hypothetical protein
MCRSPAEVNFAYALSVLDEIGYDVPDRHEPDHGGGSITLMSYRPSQSIRVPALNAAAARRKSVLP